MKIPPLSHNSIIHKTVRFSGALKDAPNNDYNSNNRTSPLTRSSPPTSSSPPISSGIVRFNVGGIIYDVQRSLIEKHPRTMLARYVSDSWYRDDEETTSNNSNNNNNNNGSAKPPLLIKRDGERFRYCLEYMRNGWVAELPPTVSREGVLQDLAYFGFHGVDPASISVGAFGGGPVHRRAHGHRIDSCIRDIEAEQELLNIVKIMLVRYHNKRDKTRLQPLQINIHKLKMVELKFTERFRLFSQQEIRERFDRVVGRFGGFVTKDVSIHKDVVSIRFEQLDSA